MPQRVDSEARANNFFFGADSEAPGVGRRRQNPRLAVVFLAARVISSVVQDADFADSFSQSVDVCQLRRSIPANVG